MSKHRLSPVPLPPPKRQHTLDSGGAHFPSLTSNFDTTFYDEVILHIFSHLSYTDLCAVQSTNRNWSRLSSDNQLWKEQYLREYGRARLRGVRGFIGRSDGREVRPLPGRARTDEIKDWKWMFRISSNWRTGRCAIEQLDNGTERPLADPTSMDLSFSPTQVVLAGNLTITASSRPTQTPTIRLHSPNRLADTLAHTQRSGRGNVRITALALDQSPPSEHRSRLASFLSTGEFSIFSIDHATPSRSSRILTSLPPRSGRTSPIIQAVYHHPLLITLSHSFFLSLYDLSTEGTVNHTQTLTSFTSYPPSSLVLSAPSPGSFKLVLTYAMPVYPAHWSVGATEILISSSPTRNEMAVSTTRTTRAFDVPPGWLDESKIRLMREQWSRKVGRVADTQTDGKWVVLAPGDNPPSHSRSQANGHSTYTSSALRTATALQLYRLQLPSSSSNPPKLTFVRNLHGHTAPVCALSLADGRCVSLSVDGSIWVWDLEGGTGAEVASGSSTAVPHEPDDWDQEEVRLRKGTVVFDERRIVSAGMGGVEMRRFDV